MSTLPDISPLLNEFQTEAGLLRRQLEPGGSQGPSMAWQDARTFNAIGATISDADAFKDAGGKVSPMDNFKGVKKSLALIAGHLIVFFLRFITDKQIRFNTLIIAALREMLTEMRASRKSIRGELYKCEAEVSDLKKQIVALKKLVSGNEESRDA